MNGSIKALLTIAAITLTIVFSWLVCRQIDRSSSAFFGFDPLLLVFLAIWLALPLILLISLFKCHIPQTLIWIWSITIVIYFILPVKWEIENLCESNKHNHRVKLLEMLENPSANYEQIKEQSQRGGVELIALQLEALYRQRTDIVQHIIDDGHPLKSLGLNVHSFLERYYYEKSTFLSDTRRNGQSLRKELPPFPSTTAYKSIKFMIDHGIDVNAPGLSGGNGLISALWSDDKPTIELLCNAGINFVQCAENNCSITAAIYNDNIEMAKKFIDYGLDINYLDPYNATPLCYYTYSRDRDNRKIEYSTIKFLLENGADPNLTVGENNSPLYYCVTNSDQEVISLLIKHGANVNYFDGSGTTILSQAVYSDASTDIIKLLIKNGADVNRTNKYDYDAIYYAVEKNDLEIVKILVEKGAPLDRNYPQDKTLLTIVDKEHNPELWEYLKAQGAK